MRILLGPAGIPLAAKGKSTVEGVKVVAELGLQCMEIEFVQQVYMDNRTAKQVGKTAKDLGVQLSVHAPYYINLLSENEKILEASKRRILQSVERAHHMNAKVIAVHAGYYGKFSPGQAFEKIKTEFEDVLEDVRKNSWDDVLIGCETMGREKQWGTLGEILKLSREVKGCYPYIDFGHVFVRNNGRINYSEIFDQLKKGKIKFIYSHFEGVGKNKDGKFVDVHTPIDHAPPFEPLAEEILKRGIDIAIVCESPLIDQDALSMRAVFEKLCRNF